MRKPAIVLASLTVLGSFAAPAWAFNCPVVIKQAEDLIKKAEAKVKRDHGDAIRKAKVAAAFAEEAITLQNP
jgi:hypothetical protein